MSDMEVGESTSRPNISVGTAASSSLNCKFLGSLTSRRGREILSQLCLQIAHKSKLQHHFVERKDLDKRTREFFNKSIKSASTASSPTTPQAPPEQAVPFEMKVFFVRDQLERISDEQVNNYINYNFNRSEIETLN